MSVLNGEASDPRLESDSWLTFAPMRCSLAILLLTFSDTLSGQSFSHTLELRSGPEHSMRQDLLLSPFVHTDASFVNFALRWERSKMFEHFLQLHFRQHNHAFGEPYTVYYNDSTSYVTIPNYWTMVDVDYALGKTLDLPVRLIHPTFPGRSPSKPADVTVGAIFTNNVNATPLSTGNFTTFGYFANFSLGGWARVTKDMLEGTGSASLVLPLFGLTARSPYLLNDDAFIENTVSHNGFVTFFAYLADGRINTLNRLFNPSVNLRYMKPLGGRWNVTLNYDFEYIRHNKPLALTSFQNSVMIGLAYRYGTQKNSE